MRNSNKTGENQLKLTTMLNYGHVYRLLNIKWGDIVMAHNRKKRFKIRKDGVKMNAIATPITANNHSKIADLLVNRRMNQSPREQKVEVSMSEYERAFLSLDADEMKVLIELMEPED